MSAATEPETLPPDQSAYLNLGEAYRALEIARDAFEMGLLARVRLEVAAAIEALTAADAKFAACLELTPPKPRFAVSVISQALDGRYQNALSVGEAGSLPEAKKIAKELHRSRNPSAEIIDVLAVRIED